jgi:hypothetical protein
VPLYLYDLPNGVLGALFIVGWVAAGVGGQAIFQQVCGVSFSDGDRSLATAILAVMATVNSLLLAFTAVAVWEAYGHATQTVNAEASTVGQLSRDLAAFGTDHSSQALERLKDYAHEVIKREWPAMRRDETSETTWHAFELMFMAVSALQPTTPREMALMPEIWARTNELFELRRARLGATHEQVPHTLWIAVFSGTLLTLLPTFVLPRTRFSQTAIVMLSLSMGLMFFFIVAMDRPFVGRESVSPEPFESALHNAEIWDSQASGTKNGLAKSANRDNPGSRE